MSVFRFIEAERASFPISLSCRMLGVSRSGFHAWRRRAPSQRSLEDAWLLERIRQIHERSRRTYGSPRVHAELRRQGVHVGRKRVERLMRQAGISGLLKRRKQAATIPVQGLHVVDDLVARDFGPDAPDRLWCADLKQIPTSEGVLYLGSVLDCFSRRVVGWSMRRDMKAELVVDALEMAVARRQPRPGLIHHSDRGSQYVSLVFGRRCRQAGIARSMGSKGDAYDNAVKESFFASLEKDLLRRRSFRTRRQARSEVFDYIEVFYNRERLHSTLGYRSPEEYEQAHERNDRQRQEETIIEEQREAA